MALTVVATFVAKPGKEKKLREELLARIEPTRKEAGCISYDLHQAIDNPATFIFVENWKNKEELDKHLQMPYLQSLLGLVSELCGQEPSIVLANQIS
jgi:quinol monooxygenase YgiN